MDGLVAYILAKKMITSVASGISNVTLDEDNHILSFQFSDGTSQSITIPMPKDGITPHIGANGNWYIGEIDTDVSAEGPQGLNGFSITNVKVNEDDHHLYCTLSNNEVIDAGEIPIIMGIGPQWESF